MIKLFLAPLRNLLGSEKEDFLAEISDLKSSIQKLSNNLDNFLEAVEIEKDKEWNFYEDTFISVSNIYNSNDNLFVGLHEKPLWKYPDAFGSKNKMQIIRWLFWNHKRERKIPVARRAGRFFEQQRRKILAPQAGEMQWWTWRRK